MVNIVSAKENDIRNILIIGYSGAGKSALANTLTSTNQFEEKGGGLSVTKNFQKSEVFEWKGKKYRVIDNIGFGNTSISEEDILLRIGEGIHSAKEGINQILFVFGGRFSDEQIATFYSFKDFIDENNITGFTTIIKTRFADFRKLQKCKEDLKNLKEYSKETREIVESCNGFLHVNNSPTIIEEEGSDNEQEIAINKKKRKKSRKIVLDHLVENCSEIYKFNTDVNSCIGYLFNSLPVNKDNEVEIKEQLTLLLWKNINKNFNKELIESWKSQGFNYYFCKKWTEAGFNYEQAKQWINAGAKPSDYNFVNWLINIKNLNLEWALNNQEEFKELRDKRKYLGTCQECDQPRTGRNWCQTCNKQHFQQDKWTSGNSSVDQFIRKYQLEATDAWNILEWIPYEEFENIEHIADGGFAKVYKAQWKEGSIKEWNIENNDWKRGSNQEVALKLLNNSTSTDTNFLKEIALYKMFINETNNVVKCYGISQHPETKNYVIVMEYLRGDSLRKYLQNNYRELKFEDKLNQLCDIARGLKDIHSQSSVHGDFHSGNILYPPCRVIDLGVNEEEKGKIYGLMPYVAPEVLQSKPYTQASDIYSLGMIAYEIFSGLPPYHGSAHDLSLSLQICRGTRPNFEIKIPQLLKDLIKICWDAEPNNRPTASELVKISRVWQMEIGNRSGEFYQQLLEAEKHNQILPDEIKYPSREKSAGVTYNSQMINTTEITQALTQGITSGISSLEIDIDYIEEDVEEKQLQTNIEQPPK